MKQFFKFMFASVAGFALAMLVVFFLLMGFVASLAALTQPQEVVIEPKSVLHLRLNQTIVDRGVDMPFQGMNFMGAEIASTVGLNDILENIRKAEKDPNIEGIFLELSIIMAGWGTVAEIREALSDFSESGKFIVAYGESKSQKAYYLASVADSIFINPLGSLDFRGLNTELTFFKGLFDRLGIEVQLVKYGDFKSAAEPLTQTSMSSENRMQITAYMQSLWQSVLNAISQDRGIEVAELNRIADAFLSRSPELALENGLIDGIKHRDEVMELLSRKLEKEDANKIELVNLSDYSRVAAPRVGARSRNRIAVVYGSGSIMPGQGSDQQIGSDRIAAAIREARIDTAVKAIVFRVNSPGGSALASEVIHREVYLAAKVKPVVVSMGDVAGSGGYYIAAPANLIVANAATLTGSIGVFGIIPNMQGFFNEELGVTFDNVKTNTHADLMSIHRPLSQQERWLLEQEIGRIYNAFIAHVAAGRNITVQQADQLGQGRIYSGIEAKELGLVDELGGLNHAIARAAEKAGITEYRVVELPERKDFFTQLTESLIGVRQRIIRQSIGDAYKYYQQINNIKEFSGIQARMPWQITVE
ncbi:MAG TPA: signal peptide peptidase SppA [Bacteroidales bacterium]|nr:signal peptide peptidase SppA [Bacteroidales bacterium]